MQHAPERSQRPHHILVSPVHRRTARDDHDVLQVGKLVEEAAEGLELQVLELRLRVRDVEVEDDGVQFLCVDGGEEAFDAVADCRDVVSPDP